MTKAEVKRFLAQFERSRDNFARWPQWMREASVVASASLPRSAEAANKKGGAA